MRLRNSRSHSSKKLYGLRWDRRSHFRINVLKFSQTAVCWRSLLYVLYVYVCVCMYAARLNCRHVAACWPSYLMLLMWLRYSATFTTSSLLDLTQSLKLFVISVSTRLVLLKCSFGNALVLQQFQYFVCNCSAVFGDRSNLPLILLTQLTLWILTCWDR